MDARTREDTTMTDLEELKKLAEAATPVSVEGSPLLEWAVAKWNQEVKHRPLKNVHRRSLDDAWRQVIRWAGGDPDLLIGPSHDEMIRGE